MIAAANPSLLADVVLPGVVSLIVALTVLLLGWIWNSRQQRRADDAQLYAAAYAAVQQYKEFPYVVRRRNPVQPAEERVRISEALREVQGDLAFHLAWVGLRDADVAKTYELLVRETRGIAGRLMHDAWKQPGIDIDADMNIPDIHTQLEALEPAEDAFLKAVSKALKRPPAH